MVLGRGGADRICIVRAWVGDRREMEAWPQLVALGVGRGRGYCQKWLRGGAVRTHRGPESGRPGPIAVRGNKEPEDKGWGACTGVGGDPGSVPFVFTHSGHSAVCSVQ